MSLSRFSLARTAIRLALRSCFHSLPASKAMRRGRLIDFLLKSSYCFVSFTDSKERTRQIIVVYFNHFTASVACCSAD